MFKMKKKWKISNGYSDGMAGPIFKILEVLEVQYITFRWEKIEKNRKMNSKILGPKISKFGPLQIFNYLT